MNVQSKQQKDDKCSRFGHVKNTTRKKIKRKRIAFHVTNV